MSPSVETKSGFLTITLRKQTDYIVILDESGEQIARIYARLQGSITHGRIGVSIRADQRYRIHRGKAEE